MGREFFNMTRKVSCKGRRNAPTKRGGAAVRQRGTQLCGAMMRLGCDRRGRACGDAVLQSLPVWELLGGARKNYDDSKCECFATMDSSFAMGKLGGVLWEEGRKDGQEGGEGEETETVAIAGVRVADMRNERENNSTLPKLAKIGLGRKRVTDWRGVWPGSLLSLLLPAVLSPGRFSLSHLVGLPRR